jgi:hypothetical protein
VAKPFGGAEDTGLSTGTTYAIRRLVETTLTASSITASIMVGSPPEVNSKLKLNSVVYLWVDLRSSYPYISTPAVQISIGRGPNQSRNEQPEEES